MAAVGAASAVGLFVAAQVPPLRQDLLRLVPEGAGPDEARREKSWFKVDFIAESDGRKVHTRVSGGDPGYTETAKMLAESALCLAYDENPKVAGQVTTAEAMGRTYRPPDQRRDEVRELQLSPAGPGARGVGRGRRAHEVGPVVFRMPEPDLLPIVDDDQST